MRHFLSHYKYRLLWTCEQFTKKQTLFVLLSIKLRIKTYYASLLTLFGVFWNGYFYLVKTQLWIRYICFLCILFVLKCVCVCVYRFGIWMRNVFACVYIYFYQDKTYSNCSYLIEIGNETNACIFAIYGWSVNTKRVFVWTL